MSDEKKHLRVVPKEEVKKLVTFEDLRAAMADYVERRGVKDWEATTENVVWFVAMQEAGQLRQESRKGMAHILLQGTQPINEEYVVEWLEIIQDEDAEEEEWPDWEAEFADFFGC